MEKEEHSLQHHHQKKFKVIAFRVVRPIAFVILLLLASTLGYFSASSFPPPPSRGPSIQQWANLPN